MSVYASRWALEQLARPDCPLSPTARTVLLVLAAEANYHTGHATSGQPRLAALAGVHADTVYRAVRELSAWAPLPRTDTRGKGARWHFPTSPDITDEVVHTPRVDAAPQVVHTPRVEQASPRAHAGGPPAPTRGKGLGTTYKKGAPEAAPEITTPQPPQWIREGIQYGEWVRRERKAGRVPKNNPPRAIPS